MTGQAMDRVARKRTCAVPLYAAGAHAVRMEREMHVATADASDAPAAEEVSLVFHSFLEELL